MVTKEFYKDFFENKNEEWIDGAYNVGEYSYPTGFHRLRVLKKILGKYDIKGKKILDIGCGSGNISLLLAEMGAEVWGIDRSESMIMHAQREMHNHVINNYPKFLKEDFYDLSDQIINQKFDFVIAFGFIGYLDNDDSFFQVISRITHEKSILIVSFRNELFNFSSISSNTVREIKANNAIAIINEMEEYYKKGIDENKAIEYLDALEEAIHRLKKIGISKANHEMDEIGRDGVGEIQPRQSTPQGVKAVSKKFGMEVVSFYGIHPHLMTPRFNKILPPYIYNVLSDALCVYEEEDIALIWSSVFIAEIMVLQ